MDFGRRGDRFARRTRGLRSWIGGGRCGGVGRGRLRCTLERRGRLGPQRPNANGRGQDRTYDRDPAPGNPQAQLPPSGEQPGSKPGLGRRRSGICPGAGRWFLGWPAGAFDFRVFIRPRMLVSCGFLGHRGSRMGGFWRRLLGDPGGWLLKNAFVGEIDLFELLFGFFLEGRSGRIAVRMPEFHQVPIRAFDRLGRGTGIQLEQAIGISQFVAQRRWRPGKRETDPQVLAQAGNILTGIASNGTTPMLCL